MNSKQIRNLIFAGAIRYLFLSMQLFETFKNRVEISTPLNSIKRLKEGIYLYNNGINPYNGDIFHETPTFLVASTFLHNNLPSYGISLVYILADLLSAILMYKMARNFVKNMLEIEKVKKKDFADDSEELQFHEKDVDDISNTIFLAFLFNPFSIMNCCALTSTVFSILFLSIFFYSLTCKNILFCSLFLAFETTRNFYPFVLIAPAILVFSKNTIAGTIKVIGLYLTFLLMFVFINYMIVGNWTFLNGTITFILNYGDLQPNIGLFWYFFTEMFEQFRTMFLVTFQMNATVLYLLPMTFRMRKDPIMLGLILCSVMAIFKSYPCYGDVGFYIAMLPLWKKCYKFMAHSFVVFCFFLITMLIMPTLWHLWIYSGSANSNFYFGATSGFCTGQIFLLTDLLFAYVKKEFCIKNGQKILIDGKEAKICLQ